MTLIPLKSETENLVFGSSIIAKLENDRNIPNDCAIHAYRGSSTKEKINVLSKYEKRNQKTLILQDGTNSVLKSNKTSDELFADYVELVEKSVDKFSPENVVLCEIIPLKNLPQNKDKNVIIDDFNKLLNDYIEDKPLYKVLSLNKTIKQIPQYNSIYHDNVQLNYRIGIPWLKNQILAQLMSTSNGMCQSSEPDNQQRQNRNPLANRSCFNNYSTYHNQHQLNYYPY